jgi:hypothetical protein
MFTEVFQLGVRLCCIGKPTVVHNAKENQAATVEIKERIEQMKQELEQTNLTEVQLRQQ